METEYYNGNYTSRYGYPYVIMSVDENDTHVKTETIIIFEAFNGNHVYKAYRRKWEKVKGWITKDYVIAADLDYCKQAIFHDIVFQNYKDKIEQYGDRGIELKKAEESMLIIIRNKFPDMLNNIENTTMNPELKTRIGLYKSITIERDDF